MPVILIGLGYLAARRRPAQRAGGSLSRDSAPRRGRSASTRRTDEPRWSPADSRPSRPARWRSWLLARADLGLRAGEGVRRAPGQRRGLGDGGGRCGGCRAPSEPYRLGGTRSRRARSRRPPPRPAPRSSSRMAVGAPVGPAAALVVVAAVVGAGVVTALIRSRRSGGSTTPRAGRRGSIRRPDRRSIAVVALRDVSRVPVRCRPRASARARAHPHGAEGRHRASARSASRSPT